RSPRCRRPPSAKRLSASADAGTGLRNREVPQASLASGMEAIILAGGKAERLGDAAGWLPKPLVPVAGRPLAAWQIGLLGRAGVDRVILSCNAGAGAQFGSALNGVGPELAIAEEPERLGRGGGIRFAAAERREDGDVLALNGDELLDLDFAALLEQHRSTGAAATIAVAQPRSPF